MKLLKAIFGHLKTVLIHKYWVFYYCRKFGIPWQGITHDLSKFSWTEFSESVKYYQGGTRSPIAGAKGKLGYSLAWQHHKGRNPHHYEYWTDNYDFGTTCIEIPEKYVLEMVADWMAAGKTYAKNKGKSFTVDDELKWWNTCKDFKFIHPNTKDLITKWLYILREYEH